jgi:acyl-CoA synthetase (AMP-forming)/AMP-acid ligase II
VTTPDSGPITISEMFNHRLAADPDAPFVRALSGDPLTYAAVARAVHRLADELDAAALASDAVVGVYSLNQPQWVVASFAAWDRGRTVAAVNRLMPEETARALLELTTAERVCVVPGEPAADELGVPAVPIDLDAAGDPSGAPRPLAVPAPDHPAAILFTSGTTGLPKAFSWTHRRIGDDARNQAGSYARHPGFRETVAPPKVAPIVSFIAYGHAAVYSSMALALWTGRQLVLVPKFTVEGVQQLVGQYELGALRLNPAALHMLATTDLDVDLSSLRYVYSGTAPLSQKTRELFTQRYGVPILQGYGQSETGPISLSQYDDVVSGREPPGSVGRVLERIEVRIADSEDRPLPVGSEGEIQVKSRDVATPVSESSLSLTGDGFVRTGDVGRVDQDGFLWLTGRMIEKMVVGGFNVFPAEIEEVLRRAEGVDDAVVVALPDDRLGERPVAGVKGPAASDPEALEQHARQHLAAYKVPRAFFVLDEVPLTDRGKVDRRAVLQLASTRVGGDGEVG